MSADTLKVTIMVTASLADTVVCSFDCLWVSKMILEKQINTLTRDKQSVETVPTCKCPVSVPPRGCAFGGGTFWGMSVNSVKCGAFFALPHGEKLETLFKV